MADFTYGPAPVLVETTGEFAIGATGVLRATEGGDPVPVTDLNDSPIPSVLVGPKGAHQAFKADISNGVLDFGSVQLPSISLEAQAAGLTAVSAAVAAEAVANEARTTAEAAVTSAAEAVAVAAEAAAGTVPATIAGTKTFTGTVKVGASADPPEIIEYPGTTRTLQLRDHVYVRTRLGVGAEPVGRIPVAFNTTIDGSTLSSTQPADKVGMQNNVNFKGGFSGEAGFGMANPGFAWGANDFILTGTTAGDAAGLTDLQARLTEVHLRTPGSTINNVSGLVAESKVGPNGTGATVSGWLSSLVARGPKREATATVANAAALKVESPAAGVATNQWAIYQEGIASNKFNGDILMNVDPSAPKVLNAYEGTVRALTFTVGPTTLVSAARLTAQSKTDADVVAWLRGRAGQAGDILRMGRDTTVGTRFDMRGRFIQANTVAPLDADLANGELSMYVDATSGAMKLMFKAKDAGGTVRTGQVALA